MGVRNEDHPVQLIRVGRGTSFVSGSLSAIVADRQESPRAAPNHDSMSQRRFSFP